MREGEQRLTLSKYQFCIWLLNNLLLLTFPARLSSSWNEHTESSCLRGLLCRLYQIICFSHLISFLFYGRLRSKKENWCASTRVIWLYSQCIYQETETCCLLEWGYEFKILSKESKCHRCHRDVTELEWWHLKEEEICVRGFLMQKLSDSLMVNYWRGKKIKED